MHHCQLNYVFFFSLVMQRKDTRSTAQFQQNWEGGKYKASLCQQTLLTLRFSSSRSNATTALLFNDVTKNKHKAHIGILED